MTVSPSGNTSTPGVGSVQRGRGSTVAAAPLRVALFAEQGHPRGRFRSGVTRLVEHVVSGCRARGLPLDVFTYHDRRGTDIDGCVRHVRAKPRIVAEFHGLRVDALDVLPLRNGWLQAAAEPFKYDVVLATAPGIGTQGQLLARDRGVPFVAIYTTDLPHYAAELARSRLGRLPFREACVSLARRGAWGYLSWLYARPRASLVLVPTRAVARELGSHIGAPIEILGRGANTMSFPLVERDHRRVTRLLYVGRIDYGQKNLAALERVVREVEDVQLWAVGGGDDLPLMRRRLADQIASGRVRLTGRIDDPQRLASIYQSADVFVFPSVYDTLGQVVLEAQSAGLPVVVRERGGPAELVRHLETGFVTESDDVFVDRVRLLAERAQLRRRMGRAAKAHADSLPGWDEVVASLLARLARLAGAAAERRSRTATGRRRTSLGVTGELSAG